MGEAVSWKGGLLRVTGAVLAGELSPLAGKEFPHLSIPRTAQRFPESSCSYSLEQPETTLLIPLSPRQGHARDSALCDPGMAGGPGGLRFCQWGGDQKRCVKSWWALLCQGGRRDPINLSSPWKFEISLETDNQIAQIQMWKTCWGPWCSASGRVPISPPE